jgi:methionine-rich copper-binding protein CopC
VTRPTPGPGRWRPRHRPGHPVLTLLLGVLLAPLVALLAAPTASAHNALLSTTPARGAVLTAMPAVVALHFDLPSGALGTQVVVLGPTGNVAAGASQLIDDDVRQPIDPGSPAGRYTVNWRAISADGHPVQGTFGFTTTRRAAGTAPTRASAPPAAATPASSSWRPVLLTALGLAAVGVLTGSAFARRRHQRRLR